MEIIYGKSPIGGNLGDELNSWLWPEIFGQNIFNNAHDDIKFIGIGTMLSDDSVYNSRWINYKKVIFGTGVRSNSFNFVLDKTYDLYFLRGPLSAYYLGENNKFITDSAYCLKLLPDFENLFKVTKKYKVGIMPYFRSDNLLKWKDIADELEMHYISPITTSSNILEIIKEISSCEYFVTEAMHGAIIADILRIPWTRFNLTTYKFEGSNVSDFKWMDWMYSLQIKNFNFPRVKLTNKINHGISKLSGNQIDLNYTFLNSLKNRIIEHLNFENLDFQLSKNENFESAIQRLNEAKENFEKKYLLQ